MLRPVMAASARARPSALAPLVKPICRALRGAGMLGVDPASDGELWDATLEACRAVVDSGMGDELRRPEVRLDVSARAPLLRRRGGAETLDRLLFLFLAFPNGVHRPTV